VLWLTKGLGPGGTERLLVDVARTVDRSRFECLAAYLLPGKDHLVKALASAGVPSTCIGSGARVDLGWPARLRRLVTAERVDVVHVQAPYPAALARPALRAMGKNRPAIVYTEHNSWDGYGLWTRIANAVTYPLDDARVAVSQPASRHGTEVLVHGVDLEEVRSHRPARERVRAELGLGEREVAILTVANLREHKDYPNLLRAARQVLDSGLPVRFLAVGQGPLEAELRAQAADLGDRFRFLGYRPDALDVMAAADVFVLASKAEGYPVSIMEALALGLPIVATSVGGVADAVRPGVEGLLVPPSRPDLLAGALEEVAGDPALRASMAAAGESRSALFDIRRATARLEEIYTSVTARRRPAERLR
jgi:glycosyltransferase involved in cell wall biosynthesis